MKNITILAALWLCVFPFASAEEKNVKNHKFLEGVFLLKANEKDEIGQTVIITTIAPTERPEDLTIEILELKRSAPLEPLSMHLLRGLHRDGNALKDIQDKDIAKIIVKNDVVTGIKWKGKIYIKAKIVERNNPTKSPRKPRAKK